MLEHLVERRLALTTGQVDHVGNLAVSPQGERLLLHQPRSIKPRSAPSRGERSMPSGIRMRACWVGFYSPEMPFDLVAADARQCGKNQRSLRVDRWRHH